MEQETVGLIRPMLTSDLEQVLAWRNHADVRRYMYTQHEISLEEHTAWFQLASADSTRHLLIFECEGSAQGFINLQTIARGGIAKWGFYAAPNAARGTGRQLGRCLLRHAFEKLKLHKICGEALAFNERSIQFHLRLGFQQEGILRDQHFDGTKYHAVVCFGLLASDWRTTIKR